MLPRNEKKKKKKKKVNPSFIYIDGQFLSDGPSVPLVTLSNYLGVFRAAELLNFTD